MCQRRQGVFEMNKIIIDGKEVEYEQGTTFEQIAKLEHCTKSAVKKSVDAAIENLKKYFEISDL